MQGFEEKCHKLAQFSQKACKIATKLDENLTDRLSLMDLNFSLDGLGKLYDDLGKACETSKLAKISSKCVDLAKKFADDVSADWLGLDINPITVESEQITCGNIEPEFKLDENEEELDDLAISGVSNDISESTNANNASCQESEIKAPLDSTVILQEAALQDEVTDDMLRALDDLDTSCALKLLPREAPQNFMTAYMSSSHGDLIPSEAYESLRDYMTSTMLSSQGNFVPNEAFEIAANEVLSSEPLQNNKTSDIPSSKVDVVPIKAQENLSVDLNSLQEVSKPHDGSSNVVPSHKIDKIIAETSDILNIINEILLSEGLQNNKMSDIPSLEDDAVPTKTHVDLNALLEVSKSHDGSHNVVPSNKTDGITVEADDLAHSKLFDFFDEAFFEDLQRDLTSNMPSSHVDVVPIEANVDPIALAEVSKSHNVNSPLGPCDKTGETSAETDNLVNFSKPLEFGAFEDVDLKDDWEDDIDYDLDLLSYNESNKKPSKKKMAVKFISRLQRSIKSCSGKVAHEPDANSADSDWELL